MAKPLSDKGGRSGDKGAAKVLLYSTCDFIALRADIKIFKKVGELDMWKHLLRIGSLIASAFVAVVVFSGYLVTLRDNVYKLFIGEPAKIALTNATSTISKDAPSIMPIRFIVVVEHENKEIQCSGEGSGTDSMLSSKDPKFFIAEGKQSKIINLEVPDIAIQNFKYDLVNFRLDCDHFGKTPYIPIDIIAQNIQQQKPPSTPTKSFKVCAGNGGGPSCQATADAYYTCAQYRSIGGGAQVTYDTLGKRFCEYKQDGNTSLAPYKVLHDFSVAGGECGWTGFTVICNP